MKKRKGDVFIYNFSKRGLSAIVINLILVLLGMVAIGIVWAVVDGIIRGATDNIGIGQFTIGLDITDAYEYEGNIIATLKRNSGTGDISKLMFVMNEGDESESYIEGSSLIPLQTRKFTIPVSQLNSIDIKTISVAAISSSSGEEIVGGILDTYTITESYTGGIPPGGDDGTGDDGNGEEPCIPNCLNLFCGPDPICGSSCGTCSSGFICTNGRCISSSCVPESVATTCGTSNCGSKLNNCGQSVNCGVCAVGQICTNGMCEQIVPVNSGVVEELWPGDSGMYFGSSSLSTTTSYAGYYAKFPGSVETSCLLIVIHRFPIEGYPKSHIGFSFGTSLQVGDNYNIYSTIDGCSV